MNWKTTVLGALCLANGIFRNLDVIATGNLPLIANSIYPYVGEFLAFLVAKDADKTGIVSDKVIEKYEHKAD